MGCSQKDGNQSEFKPFYASIKTDQQYFNVEFSTEKDIPLPVNEFHNWIITVKDADNQPVASALFSISGGMPAHGHGLPTQPIVTKYLENGKYLLEGMKFNMNGEWIINIQIIDKKQQDKASIRFEVNY
jgi:hypothetical protein